jgi:RecA-family ATPase
MAKDFAPIRNLIAGYVIEGLTLLAGAPKVGKSWMALGWGVNVASGTPAFGTIAVEQGEVLYLALEDNERRLKKRLRKMGVINAPERLTLVTQWPDLDNGCVAEMEAWANDVARPILVIVDVLNKVRPVTSGRESQYEADYKTLGGLHAFASTRNIAVVVVHHTRKMDAEDPFDTVSGSRGLTGAADTVLVLRREAASRNPMLYGRGRDIEEIENAMMFDAHNATWRVVGEAWAVAKTDERQQILDVLNKSRDPMSPKDVAEQLGKERSNINKLLIRMVDEDKASRVGTGLYAPRHSVHSVPSHSEQGEQSERVYSIFDTAADAP